MLGKKQKRPPSKSDRIPPSQAYSRKAPRAYSKMHYYAPYQGNFLPVLQHFWFMGLKFFPSACVYGHITLNTPVLVRSLKLSKVETC